MIPQRRQLGPRSAVVGRVSGVPASFDGPVIGQRLVVDDREALLRGVTILARDQLCRTDGALEHDAGGATVEDQQSELVAEVRTRRVVPPQGQGWHPRKAREES